MCFFLAQRVGCDHVLGSSAGPDACGVCRGDNSTCKIYKGLYTKQHFTNRESSSEIVPFSSFFIAFKTNFKELILCSFTGFNYIWDIVH